MSRRRLSKITWLVCVCISTAAAAGPSSEDGLYNCRVVQLRTAPTCDVPRPACADALGPFQMLISGGTVSWVDCFSCDGKWTDGDFSCQLDAGATTGGPGGEPCPPEPWVVLQEDPDPFRPLDPGEIYAGIPVSNAYNAHCAPVACNAPNSAALPSE